MSIKKEYKNIETIVLKNIETVIIQIYDKDSVIAETTDDCRMHNNSDWLNIIYKPDCSHSGINVNGDINISFSGMSQVAIGNNIHQSIGNNIRKTKCSNSSEVKLFVPIWITIKLDGVDIVRTMFSESKYITMEIRN